MHKEASLLRRAAVLSLVGLVLLAILLIGCLRAGAAGWLVWVLLVICLGLNVRVLARIGKAGSGTGAIENAAEAARLDEQSSLVQALRVQRHDFANHLQVIAGLAQLGKSERLLAYIQEVAAESAGLNAYAALKQAEIRTALLAKAYVAEACRLHFDLVAETDLADFRLDPVKVSVFISRALDLLLAQAGEATEGADRFTLHLGEDTDLFSLAIFGQQEVLGRFTQTSPALPGGLTVGDWLRSEFGGTLEFIPLSDGEAKVVLRFPKPGPAGMRE